MDHSGCDGPYLNDLQGHTFSKWPTFGEKHAKIGVFEVHCVSGPPATTIRQNDLILGDMLTSYMGMMHVVLIIWKNSKWPTYDEFKKCILES